MAAPVTVLVTFYSRAGGTERLAHAAAVGAVQKRAAIRLRRVADADPRAVLERLPDARESLRRMHTEYVAPREADVLAADALILGSPADVEASSPEWSEFMNLLRRLHAEGRLVGKVAAVITQGRVFESFSSVIRGLGLAVVPPDPMAAGGVDEVGGAVALGRQVVSVAQARGKE